MTGMSRRLARAVSDAADFSRAEIRAPNLDRKFGHLARSIANVSRETTTEVGPAVATLRDPKPRSAECSGKRRSRGSLDCHSNRSRERANVDPVERRALAGFDCEFAIERTR
jgi:hypothetical protein